MSGFLIAACPFDQADWGRRLAFAPGTGIEPLALAPWHGVLSYFGSAHERGAARAEAAGVTVAVAGRASLDERDWTRAGQLAVEGGLAARFYLDAWNEQPQRASAAINGAVCLIVHDARRRELHLLTDRMGVFPVYANSDGPPVLASHPDVLADFLAAQGRPPALDTLTLAEMLRTGCSVHPHTYHRGIVQLDPATHYTFDLAQPQRPPRRASYWEPPRELPAGSAAAVAESIASAFAEGLRSAGRRRAARLGRHGLLLSGGADSRALLYTAASPSEVTCLTFCDRDNPEVDTARAIAAAVGAPHRVLHRAFEHYGDGATESVRASGGMWSIKDAHYHGFAGELHGLALGNLMTGCYTDYLYKGLGYNRRAMRVLGKRLSLDEPAPYAAEYYQPYSHIAPHWAARVAERGDAWIAAADIAAYARDPFAVEDRRIRPLSREADAMGRLYLLRTQPWDPVMVENELVDWYGRIPPALKLNARVFRAAVARVLPAAARHIRNNNDFSPIGASEPARVMRYLWRKSLEIAARRLRGADAAESLATNGSWPNFRYYVARSEVLATRWATPTPAQRELFADLLGADPFADSLDVWAHRDIDLILRLLTLKIWLDLRQY